MQEKNYVFFLTGGTYAPHAPCLATPLPNSPDFILFKPAHYAIMCVLSHAQQFNKLNTKPQNMLS